MNIKECQSVKFEWADKLRGFSQSLKIENIDNVYRKLLIKKDVKMLEKSRISADFCNLFAQMAISDIEGWFESDDSMIHNDIAIN